MKTRTGATAMAVLLGLVTSCSTSITGTAFNTSATSGVATTGTTPEGGTSTPVEPSADPTGQETDQSGAGGYPTTPNVLPATVGSEEAGRIAEGARLAEYVLVPTFVLTDYIDDNSTSTYVIQDAAALSQIVAEPVPTRAEANGMISGFSSSRQTVPDGAEYFAKSVINAVLTFPSPEQAATAAAQMNEAIGARPGGSNVVLVPGFDDQAVAKVRQYSEGVGAEIFMAHNSVVHYVWNQTLDDSPETMAQNLSALLLAQIPASESFVPTLLENVGRLPADRDGMLAHTLLQPTGAGDTTEITRNRVFGIRGMKHFFVNPLDDESTITAAGVDLVARGLTAVYRAKDDTGALLLQAEYWRQYGEYFPDTPEVSGPSEVPGVQCIGDDEVRICVFTRGRYTVEANGASESDVNAIILAQYELLKDF